MAVHYIFKGSHLSNTDDHELECYDNEHGEIFLNIEDDRGVFAFISLEVDTAVKLSKQLRKSIANIKNQ